MKCVYTAYSYIYICSMCCLGASVYLCTRGFQKEKKIGKKLQDQQKLQKKRFLFKTCYFHKSFLAHKRIIYFCRCILEDDILDLIATGDLIVTKLWKVSNKLQ